ncbi:1-(5-phosphoribosyl)-5-[(5-phosphoribosylamino)methylideneamino]imidazole-4-carboxamide isomerase [Myroides sp. LJL116]
MKIIPAIDIIQGKCVRLSKGDFSTQKVYSADVVEVAKRYEDHGITHLHLVDLDGAKSGRVINYNALEAICVKTNLKVDFSGGLSTDKDLSIAFECGANQVSIGSVASLEPDLFLTWLDFYGSEKIILGADCQNGRIKTRGWLEDSKDQILPYLNNYMQKGIKYSIVTDIDKDGMLEGPSFSLYEDILAQGDISLIASGGISCVEDLYRLKEIGCYATIVGKAIYENKITLKQIEKLW